MEENWYSRPEGSYKVLRREPLTGIWRIHKHFSPKTALEVQELPYLFFWKTKLSIVKNLETEVDVRVQAITMAITLFKEVGDKEDVKVVQMRQNKTSSETSENIIWYNGKWNEHI